MLDPQTAARVLNVPLLVEPARALAALAGVGLLGRAGLLAGAAQGGPGGEGPGGEGPGGQEAGHAGPEGAPFPVIGGIAVIPVAGLLVHRDDGRGPWPGRTSCTALSAQIGAAARDPAVRAVALEIDSFGGEVAGVFDLADRIRALRSHKPVLALVAEQALSAGYALAAQADRIVLPRTGVVGSIGVVVMHTDLSGQLERAGLRVSLIHAGRHKTDGTPVAPLPDPVRATLQTETEALRRLFAETVAAGRGARLSAEAALATEAAIFRGAEAVAAGLADELADPVQAFAAFRASLAPHPVTQPEETPMTDTPEPKPETATGTEPAIGTEAPPVTAPAAAPDAAPDPGPDAAPGAGPDPRAALREEAAEIAGIVAEAARLGLRIDMAAVLRAGTPPGALRREVLTRAAEAADKRDILAAPQAPGRLPESPIVAAARRAARARS